MPVKINSFRSYNAYLSWADPLRPCPAPSAWPRWRASGPWCSRRSSGGWTVYKREIWNIQLKFEPKTHFALKKNTTYAELHVEFETRILELWTVTPRHPTQRDQIFNVSLHFPIKKCQSCSKSTITCPARSSSRSGRRWPSWRCSRAAPPRPRRSRPFLDIFQFIHTSQFRSNRNSSYRWWMESPNVN